MSAEQSSDARLTLSNDEVRRRAVAGAAILISRGALIKALGFAGNIVLARLLVPREFGLIAFGLTVMQMTTVLYDGGMGAALLGREQSPSRAELGAVNGLQLAAGFAVASIAALSALPLGSDAVITTVMVIAIPIVALRTPSSIMLERGLSYGPLALVDIAEVVGYYAWSIPAVILGAGAWGLATGMVVRAMCGTATIFYFSPVGLVMPRLSLELMRPLWRFGAGAQGSRLAEFARDQGVNVATAAIAGLAGLGLWSLAGRVINIPYMMLESLTSVSYPALSRLRDAGEDVTEVVVRSLRLTSIGTGAMFVPIVASAPALVPSLFGSQWRGAVNIVTLLPLGLLVMGPVSVSISGFLYSVGDVGAVLKAVVASAVVNLTVGIAALAVFGVTGLALGTALAYVTEAVVMLRGARRHLKVRWIVSSGPVIAGAAAIAVSLNVVTRLTEPTLLITAGSAVAGLALFVVWAAIIARPDMRVILNAARAVVRRCSSERSSGSASEVAGSVSDVADGQTA